MPLFRRRPLLRAAAVAGGGYMAGKHRGAAEAEQQSYQAVEPAPAPPQRGTSSDDIARLEQLGKLRDQGILSDEEFSAQKAQILGAA